jgi:hypothetical protein
MRSNSLELIFDNRKDASTSGCKKGVLRWLVVMV